ncbi:DUF2147 domain-containing protein [Tenacibaculum agarivorans]|uniref:DUF2147 domain-containing protein n=1 Tax=Tenacibaculum agarivorans TaxID=1908389 RepID=UPI00094B7E89|nr:DUF2147 domain-containing protein [Tenacibaculum agarivorans]
MKLIIIFTLLFSSTLNAQEAIVGVWNTARFNTKIEIKENKGVCNGFIVSSDTSKAKVGKQIVKDVQVKDGEWKGKIFSIKRNKWYNAILELKENELHVLVKAGLFKKTMLWTRS